MLCALGERGKRCLLPEPLWSELPFDKKFASHVYLAEGPHIKAFPEDPLRDLGITELTMERKGCDTEHEVATQTDAVAMAGVPMPL